MNKYFEGLRGKLIMLAIFPLIALAITTGISLSGFSKIGGMLNESYEVYVPNIRLLGQINLNRANIGYFTFAALANKEDDTNRKKFVDLLDRSIKSYQTAVEDYMNQKYISGEAEAFQSMKDHYPKYIEHTMHVREALLRGKPADYEDVLRLVDKGGPWQVLQIEVDSTITKIYEMYTTISQANNVIQAEERSSKATMILLVSLLSSAALVGIVILLSNRVSNSVGGVAKALSTVSDSVSGAITQLSAAGQSLSSASTESAASLEETVASIEELTSMVSRNSEHAKEAADLANQSSQIARDGEKEINALIQSMHDVANDSKKIEEIIKVIDDIAFQTNLLALNAAVEAARAGEQGKGFAVVADAVRNLAQRSASAAKEINQLIKESVTRTESSKKLADNSGDVLTKIVSSVEKVATLNKEISHASGEQTVGLSQISKAMNQLDQASQMNAASTQEIATTAGDIEQRSQEMKDQVLILSREVLGASA